MKSELLILGVLHRGDMHPYEIKRRLTNAMVECYTDIDVGTLYYAVGQLAKRGMIKEVGRERAVPGGERTVYRITDEGRERFLELLHAQFAATGSVADTLYGAMLFLHLADAPTVAELLRRRIERATERTAYLESLGKQLAPLLSTGGHHLMHHIEAQQQLDLKWLREVLSDVERGRVRDVPDPKRLASERSTRTED